MSGHRPWAEVRAKIEAQPGASEAIAARKHAMRVALELARVREARGLTRIELADATGVSQSNVSRVERQENIYLSTLADIVEAMGGRLEISAVFPDGAVELLVPREHRADGAKRDHAVSRRRATSAT